MDIKEKLYNYLLKQKDFVDYTKLEDALNIQTSEEKENLKNAIKELHDEYKLFISKNEKYMLYSQNKTARAGSLSLNKKGEGFVRVFDGLEEQDIFVPKDFLKYALDKDIVAVETGDYRDKYGNIIKSKKPGQKVGMVIETLNRDLSNIVGEIVKGKDGLEFKSYDTRNAIFVMDEDELKNCVEGEIVVVEEVGEISRNKYAVVIKTKLGHKDDAKMDTKIVCAKNEVIDEFPQEVLDQLETIPTEVLDKDRIGRVDLTNKTIFTIDGKDTKDIDDAISIEMSDDGKYYVLGVHIADVSYYVPEGSPLDIEAYNRGTSCYPPGSVIPMLPHKLSNGICSLNENVDRCAITCEMKIDRNGRIKDYDVYPSIIKSKKKMNYDDVNLILEKNTVPEGYEPFVNSLESMLDLAHIIRAERERRGASDFDTQEAKVVCDNDGYPIDIIARERGEGEKLIEDFMLSANSAVATMLLFYQAYSYQILFPNRTHDFPQLEKVQSFISLLNNMGHPIIGNYKQVKYSTFRDILSQVDYKNEIEEELIKERAVRSNTRAIYSEIPTGHYGLATKKYCHFTSPIRRYPDLTTHRVIRKFIFNRADEKELLKSNNAMPEICKHCSDRERKAVNAERDCVDMKMAEYMTNHIGEEFDAYISDLGEMGIFIKLENHVEARIALDSLHGFYTFDAEKQTLNSKGRKPIRLGEGFKVKVISASKEEAKVFCEIVKDLENKKNNNETFKELKLKKKHDRN